MNVSANTRTVGTGSRFRQRAGQLASDGLFWAVETVEDAVAAALCFFCLPAGLGHHLSREERRAQAVELAVGFLGRFPGLRLAMILIGAAHERPGVLSFPVGARSCARPGPDYRGDAYGYKILDAVLLRKRSSRGPLRTETLVWRVALRGAAASDTARGGYRAQTYPDRHGAFLDFYSG